MASIRGMETRGSSIPVVVFCPCGVILKGCDLSLELLVELLQLLLFTEDVLTFKHYLFSLTIELLLLFFHLLFHLVEHLKELVLMAETARGW